MDTTANTTKVDEGWIRTASGGRFTFENPSPGEVNLEDIAQALSMQCRFNGHCPRFYSVAEHSMVVAKLYERFHGTKNLAGALMHDAAEAYVGDLVAPLKRLLPEYDKYELRANMAIAARFNLPQGFAEFGAIKRMDRLALAVECRVLFDTDPIEWGFDATWPYVEHTDLIEEWDHDYAYRFFLGECTRLGLKP